VHTAVSNELHNCLVLLLLLLLLLLAAVDASPKFACALLFFTANTRTIAAGAHFLAAGLPHHIVS
jgi:hypothetical protein